MVNVLVNYFGDTRIIVKSNLYLRQADGYQILFCVIFPLSGKVPNATCVLTVPGKQFFSRADTSACVSSVPPGGLFMSLTMVLNFDNGLNFLPWFSLIVGSRSDPIHPIHSLTSTYKWISQGSTRREAMPSLSSKNREGQPGLHFVIIHSTFVRKYIRST